MADKPLKILFLCTGNACRSQMAEGWARQLAGDRIEAYSAGVMAAGLNPYAVAAMAEAGVDISRHKSKTLDDMKGLKFDYVVTVCGHAHETCPMPPGGPKVIHRGFDDPPSLAMRERTDEGRMRHFRRVRDEIKAFVQTLPGMLECSISDPIP